MEEINYMAKMRVHELAKELGIENKQINEFLNTTEHAVKSHSSNVEDAVQDLVRGKFGKGKASARQKQRRLQQKRSPFPLSQNQKTQRQKQAVLPLQPGQRRAPRRENRRPEKKGRKIRATDRRKSPV